MRERYAQTVPTFRITYIFNDLGLKICKLTMLFVVFCDREMWSLRVREENKLRACRKRVLERGSNKVAEKVA